LIFYAVKMETVSCPGCAQRDAIIAELMRRLAVLEAEVRELKARLGVNSSNSSLPPSANPPSAPKPVVKKPTGRNPGAQPGHEPHLKQRLSPDRISDIISFVPKKCGRCQAALPQQAGPNDPEPSWHQVVELPALVAEVTEYQGHTRTCPKCGVATHAAISGEIRRHGIGPRLAAFLSYLRGAHQVSQRGLEEIVETALSVPLSLGTIAHLEEQTSAALAEAHAEALEAVRAAPIKHVDETGWKRAGGWLWLAATSTVAAFVIHAQRSVVGLKALLGETIPGILCTDRWGVYNGVPIERRQVCWAHLKRDFQKCVDRGGASSKIGRAGVRIVQKMFACWHRYRDGPQDRDELGEAIAPLSRRLERVLKAGRRCADRKTATFCSNLVECWPALWLFILEEGVEPTNNHAERMLRRGVLWRKRSFGSHSLDGCRFAERMLTVVQTLRLQRRSALHYLQDAIAAHRTNSPAPKLLPAG
jgi:transposase